MNESKPIETKEEDKSTTEEFVFEDKLHSK